MEVFTIIIFVAVIALTALIFCGWIAWAILRMVIGAIDLAFGGLHRALFGRAAAVSPMLNGNGNGAAAPREPARASKCSTPGCGTFNPHYAKFCRRCGHGLPAAHRGQVRRAAVW